MYCNRISFIYLAWEFILQNRTHVAFVDKHALNRFSQFVASKAILSNGIKSEKDWKWKVIGIPLGFGIIRTTQPFLYLKKNYWGVVFAKFYNQLLVSYMKPILPIFLVRFRTKNYFMSHWEKNVNIQGVNTNDMILRM